MKKLFTAFVFIMYSGPMLLLYGQQADTLKADDYFDLSLEEIMNIRITTASKSAESIKDAPAIVSVISARDIERFGAIGQSNECLL
jgi:outer membrane receptor for ferrienterochelin and colicin